MTCRKTTFENETGHQGQNFFSFFWGGGEGEGMRCVLPSFFPDRRQVGGGGGGGFYHFSLAPSF